jgi:hypothetical protein
MFQQSSILPRIWQEPALTVYAYFAQAILIRHNVTGAGTATGEWRRPPA